jgi:hypothetical protein
VASEGNGLFGEQCPFYKYSAIMGCFMNLGHAFDWKNDDQSVLGSMQRGETTDRFDFISLVKRIKVNYHKLIV